MPKVIKVLMRLAHMTHTCSKVASGCVAPGSHVLLSQDGVAYHRGCSCILMD